MAAIATICQLRLGLADIRDGSMQNWIIGLFTDNNAHPVGSCDEDDFTVPTWTGYDGADPLPWGDVLDGIDEESVFTDSALLVFAVDSDPGSQTVYGWWAYDPTADPNTRVRDSEIFAVPIEPEEGVPIYLVVRVVHRNCP